MNKPELPVVDLPASSKYLLIRLFNSAWNDCGILENLGSTIIKTEFV